MNVADTSKRAYQSVKESLGLRQSEVFDELKKHIGGLTNEELSERLHLPIQSITGRVNELCTRFDMIEVVGERKTKSGRNAKVWAVKYKVPKQMQFV